MQMARISGLTRRSKVRFLMRGGAAAGCLLAFGPTAHASARSCANVRGAEVISASNMSCTAARKLARVWVQNVRRDGTYNRVLFGFDCRNRPSSAEGDTIVCRRGARRATWYVNAFWAANAGTAADRVLAGDKYRPSGRWCPTNRTCFTSIRWSAYNSKRAVGSGPAESCAGGGFGCKTYSNLRVALTRPRVLCGDLRFSRMRLFGRTFRAGAPPVCNYFY